MKSEPKLVLMETVIVREKVSPEGKKKHDPGGEEGEEVKLLYAHRYAKGDFIYCLL